MKGTPSLGPWPRTHVILATDIWLGLMVDLVPSLRSSASSCDGREESSETGSSCSARGTRGTPRSCPRPVPCPQEGPDLVQRDELGIQPHQVTRLRHLAQHQGDERGVTLALLASQRGLRQQHAGFDGVLDCRKRGRAISREPVSLAARPLPPRHSLTRLYLVLRFLRA